MTTTATERGGGGRVPGVRTHARRTLLAAGLLTPLAAGLLLVGCAQNGAGTAGGAGSTGTGSAGGTAPATTVAPTPTTTLAPEPSNTGTQPSDQVDASGCHRNLVLTEANASSSFCVNLGGTVSLTLHGTAEQRWSAVKVGGTALSEVPVSGIPPAGPSVTTLYRAVRAGTATLTSARPLCPSAQPGSAGCLGLQAFQVTISVH